jgi:hypothetical protein
LQHPSDVCDCTNHAAAEAAQSESSIHANQDVSMRWRMSSQNRWTYKGHVLALVSWGRRNHLMQLTRLFDHKIILSN